jgi:NADH dehydrogenase
MATVGMRTKRPGAEDATLHDVVIVGGGAAGIELATLLGNRFGSRGGRRPRARITLVECARTHLWKPLLHAAVRDAYEIRGPGEYEVNYLAQAHWHGFRYRFGEMIGLDRAAKEVRLAATFDDEGRQITPPRSVRYDTLVIAIGSVTNDFATPGVVQYAVPLETPSEAARFNRRLVNACIRAQAQEEPVRPGQLHVAIIGAGATGTELAAELNRTAREVVACGLDRINPERDIRILLFEAADRILPGLPERISKATRGLLDDMGIEVHVGAKVAEVSAEGVRLAGDRLIPSELVVWAAGVKAPDVLADIAGLETNRLNQLVVRGTLQTTRDDAIFAIGDCAACPWPGGSPGAPPLPRPRISRPHMVRQIERRPRGEPLLPYSYRASASLVSLGEYHGRKPDGVL